MISAPGLAVPKTAAGGELYEGGEHVLRIAF